MNMKKTTTKRTCKGVDEQNLNVVAQENVAMTNKGKATFRLPTVRLVTLTIVLLLAFASCKDDKTPDPECDCTVKVHPAPCDCTAAGTPACDCTEEQPKAQHSPNVPMFADKTATITTNDKFTDTQWDTICSAIAGKFLAGYNAGNDDAKKLYEDTFVYSITIIVEKNPQGYTNFKVNGSTKTLYVHANGVDNLNTNTVIARLSNGTDIIANELPPLKEKGEIILKLGNRIMVYG